MALRTSSLLLVGAFLSVATASIAAEEYRGLAVARELVGRDGQRFLLTVTPPSDRAVDARVFEMIDLEDRVEKDAGAVAAKKTKGAEAEAVEAVDLSDYTISIEAVASAATSCSIKVPTVKFKKVTLSGGRGLAVRGPGAASMFISAFPIQGDVDAQITVGADERLCGHSERDAGQFDFAKCVSSACNANGDLMTGVIYNPFGSSAQYVGAIAVTFAR